MTRVPTRSIISGFLALLTALPAHASAMAGEVQPTSRPFFCFCVGLPRNSNLEFQCTIPKLAAELGYDGLAYTSLADAPQMLQAVRQQNLQMFAVYTTVNVDPGQPGYDPRLLEMIDSLKGSPTIVWLGVVSKQYKPQSTEGDDRAVELLRQVADRAAAAGLRVALYPHVRFYAERMDDLLRLIDKVDRPNVGLTFNLCHFLAAEDPASMEQVLRRAGARLFLVSINGTSGFDPKNRANWILPLDSGTFDLVPLMKLLDQIDYRGPVGMQCYGIPGEPRAILERSILAWRDLNRRAPSRTGAQP